MQSSVLHTLHTLLATARYTHNKALVRTERDGSASGKMASCAPGVEAEILLRHCGARWHRLGGRVALMIKSMPAPSLGRQAMGLARSFEAEPLIAEGNHELRYAALDILDEG